MAVVHETKLVPEVTPVAICADRVPCAARVLSNAVVPPATVVTTSNAVSMPPPELPGAMVTPLEPVSMLLTSVAGGGGAGGAAARGRRIRPGTQPGGRRGGTGGGGGVPYSTRSVFHVGSDAVAVMVVLVSPAAVTFSQTHRAAAPAMPAGMA